MKYKMLALDLDGTLLGTDHLVAPETAEAVRAAEAAGLGVCLATGRSYSETRPSWQELGLKGPYQPMVVIGGALISEADTGRTLYHKPIAPAILSAEGIDAWTAAASTRAPRRMESTRRIKPVLRPGWSGPRSRRGHRARPRCVAAGCISPPGPSARAIPS